jgi:hypothetical protein
VSKSRVAGDALPMIRFAWLALLPLVACAATQVEKTRTRTEAAYTGTVQKVFRVVRQGADLPGMRFMGKAGSVLGRALRQNAETHQYVVRTPGGSIIAQSDDEFPVGECVDIVPETDRAGPAFRYGEATVIKSESCSGSS